MLPLETIQTKLSSGVRPIGFWVEEPRVRGYFLFEDGERVEGFECGWGRGASPLARSELAKAIWACGWSPSPEAASRALQDVAWTEWTNSDGRLAPFDV